MLNLAPPEWLVAWALTVNLWEIALFVGGVVTAIVGGRLFVSRAWPWLREFAQVILSTAQLIDSAKGLPQFIERTDVAIAEIHHELHPNMFSSMKDVLARVESTTERLERGVSTRPS